MGGAVSTVEIRPGVEFLPDAAKAFQRAEAQVQAEFGRNIDVNSTYRSWDKQMSMYNAWNAYVNGTGPYPGHSKAAHPRASFHVNGTALDSDDWVNKRIVGILAENGFIRNRLYVPNEDHHFEYLRAQDKNYGKEIEVPVTSDEMKRIAAETVRQFLAHEFKDGDTVGQTLVKAKQSAARAEIAGASGANFFKHGGMSEGTPLWLYVMPNGDFVRIRDLDTARLYKERAGAQAVVLSTEAIRTLVEDLTDAGGHDLTAADEVGK